MTKVNEKSLSLSRFFNKSKKNFLSKILLIIFKQRSTNIEMFVDCIENLLFLLHSLQCWIQIFPQNRSHWLLIIDFCCYLCLVINIIYSFLKAKQNMLLSDLICNIDISEKSENEWKYQQLAKKINRIFFLILLLLARYHPKKSKSFFFSTTPKCLIWDYLRIYWP